MQDGPRVCFPERKLMPVRPCAEWSPHPILWCKLEVTVSESTNEFLQGSVREHLPPNVSLFDDTPQS